MNGISLVGSSTLGATQNPTTDARITDSTLSRYSAQRETSALIEIITDEGDTVTISAQSNMQTSFSSYTAQGQLTDGTFSASSQTLEFFSSYEISLSVDGDLNEDEREDIRQILNSIGKTIEELVKRDDDDDDGLLQKLGELDTINSLTVSLEVSSAFQAEQIITSTRTATELPTTTDGTVSDHDDDSKDTMDKLIHRLQKTADRFQKHSEKLAGKLPKFMSKLLHKLSTRDGFGPRENDRAKQILEKMTELFESRFAKGADKEHSHRPDSQISQDQTHPGSNGIAQAIDSIYTGAAKEVQPDGVDPQPSSLPDAGNVVDPSADSIGPLTPAEPSDEPATQTDAELSHEPIRYETNISQHLRFDSVYQANLSFELYQPVLELLV